MYEIFAKLLDEKGVSLYRVSKEAHIAQATLLDWKAGRYTPKVDKLQRIADYFGVPLDFLMGNSDIKKPDSEKGAGQMSEKDIIFMQGVQKLSAADRRLVDALVESLGGK